jgi:hypothetical protein
MTEATTLADWTTPQPFPLPKLGPGVEGPLRDQLETALRRIAADPSVKALVLAGPRWHVISEAARQGRVLVVQP